MATVDKPSETPVDCLQLVIDEIEAARKEQRPMSRQALTSLVHKRTGMPLKEASSIVDAFCDEKEPALPEYLASEFAIGWLKVVAIGLVIVGGVFFFFVKRAHEQNQPFWPYLAIGALFVGLGVLSWVQSLEKEVHRKD